MISITQTVAQIKPQEFIGHLKQYFKTSPLTYVTKQHSRFCIMLYQKLGAPQCTDHKGLHSKLATLYWMYLPFENTKMVIIETIIFLYFNFV